MSSAHAFRAVIVLLGLAGRAAAFEFEPLDPGSEVPVLDATAGPRGARSAGARTTLPLLRGGTVGGRLAVQGMYERRGERVYFETRRGPLAQDASVAAAHPYEIDVCFRDGNGLPLFASISGDEALIADCEPRAVSEQLAQHPELLTGFNRSYLPMRKAARAIEKAAFATTFAREKGELVQPPRQAARLLPRRRPLERVFRPSSGDDTEESMPEPTPLPLEGSASSVDGVSEADPASSSLAPRATVYWKHMLGVHTGRVSLTPFDHTATIAYTAYSFDRRFSYALFSWQQRNHGRHWYEAGMRHKCSYHSSFNRGPSIWRQKCNTTYNPTSIWGHNCNDDAAIQIWSIKSNRPYANDQGFPCNDGWAHFFTPSCLPNG